MHISIAPETIFHIGNFSVTNSLLTSWLVVLVLCIGAFIISRNIKNVPGKIQNIAEVLIENLLSFMENIAGDRKNAERFFPIVATIFIFVLLSNWSGILPGVGSIGIFEGHGEEKVFVPIFRSVFADLNMTLALALIVVTLSHFFGFIFVGLKGHIGKFISLKSPVSAFTGILEIVGEVSKVLSLSFRLFGNIFAGEVLLIIIGLLIPYVAPIPFLAMELFVGLIQALIFAVLAMLAFSTFSKAHH